MYACVRPLNDNQGRIKYDGGKSKTRVTTTTTIFICMTIQAHTVLQKIFQRIKIAVFILEDV